MHFLLRKICQKVELDLHPFSISSSLVCAFAISALPAIVVAADSSDLATAMSPYSFLSQNQPPPDYLNDGLRQIERIGQEAIRQIPQFQQSNVVANQSDLEAQARSISRKINPALPIKSGRDMTLVRVDQSGALLIYNHTIDTKVPPENYPILADWLRGQSYKSACSVPELVKFVNTGGALHYRYFINGTLVNSTKIEGCR